MEGYVQGALRNEVHTAPYGDLKQLLWEGPADEFCQYLEQFT